MFNARSGYRKLLRSCQKSFAGDEFALKSARAQLKIEFIKNKSVVDERELGYYLYISSIHVLMT